MMPYRYLFPHYAFYVREMKVKVFSQLLESYRSLTLKYMAESFNVTEEYMDRELSRSLFPFLFSMNEFPKISQCQFQIHL